jgi:alkanesulfonate monooxygenase SsuD/methylene tetrahydromethanopterin reductase-like flavin-dependent oxidoreductase (luciferase family)
VYDVYGIPYAESQARFREALDIILEACTEETFPRVGEMGLPIFVGLRGMDISVLRRHVRAYRRAWREAGHAGAGNVYLRIPVYAADTEKAAREEPLESVTFYFSRQADLQQGAVGREGAGPAERLQARVERLAGLSYEQILAERVAFGSAAGLIDRLRRLKEELTLDGVVAELDAGGLIPAERVKKSLAILTQQVMPAFK